MQAFMAGHAIISAAASFGQHVKMAGICGSKSADRSFK